MPSNMINLLHQICETYCEPVFITNKAGNIIHSNSIFDRTYKNNNYDLLSGFSDKFNIEFNGEQYTLHKLIVYKKRKNEELLYELISSFSEIRGKKFDDVMQSCFSKIADILNIDGVCLVTVDEENMKVFRKVYNINSVNEQFSDIDKTRLVYQSATENKYFSIPSVSSENIISEADKTEILAVGVNSMVVIPVIYEENERGCITFLCRKERIWNEAEMFILKLLARLIGNFKNKFEAQSEFEKWNMETECLFDMLPASIYIKDKDLVYKRVNREILDMLNLRKEDVVGKTDFDIFPPDIAIQNAEEDKKLLEEGGSLYLEKEFYNAGAKKFIKILTRKYPIYDKDKNIFGIAGALFDITNEVSVENTLNETERKLKFMLNHLPISVWTLDSNMNLNSIHGSILEDNGINIDDVLGRNVCSCKTFCVDEKSNEIIKNVFGGKFVSYCINLDGRSIYNIAGPVNSSEGVIIGVIGASFDNTGERRTISLLERSEEKYRALFENIDIGVCVLGRDLRIISLNEKYKSYFPESSVGSKSISCTETSDKSYKCDDNELCQCIRTFKDAKPRTTRIIVPNENGNRYFKVSTSAILNSKGEVDEVIEIYSDITESVEREELLRSKHNELVQMNRQMERKISDEVSKNIENSKIMFYQSRLAAMGEMIGNIAHQWRQPLNNITLTVHEMMYDVEDEKVVKEEYKEYLNKIESIVVRMSATIDDFRNFFKKSKRKERFRVIDSIAETLSLIDAGYNTNNIGIGVFCDRDIVIYGYPNEFSQVLMNLLSNSKDAILASAPDKPAIDIRAYEKNGKAYIELEDNGGGIQPEVLSRIFEPYFTTKEEGQGTGIGLYMSKMIIEHSMGGELNVENSQKGAKFIIVLDVD